MMKRLFLLIISTMAVLSLAGCAGVNAGIEDQMVKKSGVMADTNYQRYEEYSEAGKLNKEGYYSEAVFDEEESSTAESVPSDTVHVSFSTNTYLEVQYFSDKEKEFALDLNNCNLKLGDSIYATVSVSKDAASSLYNFTGFRIYQHDGDDRDLLITKDLSEDDLVLQVTEEYIGKNISIAPIGDYQTRVISLKDSYIDNNEKEHNLSGTWVINDQKVTGNDATINPVSSYVISYEFDGGQYFYLSSDPECYYSNNEDGIVIFTKRESTDDTEDYSVILHEYVSVALLSAENRYVTLNSSRGVIYNGSEQEVKANTEVEIPQLKYGDIVTIATDKEWKDLENCRELIYKSHEEISRDGQTYYVYTMIVPQKGGEFVFNPADYTYDHGTITFKCFGEVVTSPQYLAKGTRIVYEENTAEDGYWLAGDNHVIIVGDDEETRKQLESIHFTQKVKVSVALKQPDFGGTIHYYVDGNEITTGVYKTYSGTVINMKFVPWEGWISEYKNSETYTVLENVSQTLTINGNSISTAFKEDPEHKPTLEVILDKSVGKDMQFKFAASGLTEKDYQYEDGWFRTNYMIIDPKKVSIGTEEGITISMGNRAIPSGKAVKILVEKEDKDKKKSSYYRLVTDLSELQDPIHVYEKGELGNSKIWYKAIKITISIVDVLTFEAPPSLEHAAIMVHNTGTADNLKNGDLIEGSQQVTVSIKPDKGYYVTGSDVTDDVYKKTLKFSEYQSDVQSIISEHPVEKYYEITLKADDEYGTCTYKLGKTEVFGTIQIKDGQEITIEYSITSPGYVIDGSSGFLGSPVGKDDQKRSEIIKVTADMDGQTISRETFGINVVKGK